MLNIKSILDKSTLNQNDVEREKIIFEKIKNDFSSNEDLIFAGELLKLAYEKYPNNKALISHDKSITYKELYFRATELSKKLHDQGIKARDKVIIYAENSIFFYIAYFAVWQIGGIVVPLNTFLHEKELSFIINDSEPKLIFCSESLKINLDKLTQVGLIQNLPPILTQESVDWSTAIPSSVKFEITKLGIDELCALLYTSGTTGVPKGVMLSSRNAITNAMQSYARFQLFNLTDQDKFFCVLPLFHVFAQCTCLWLPIMTGSTIIVVAKIDRKQILDGLKHKPGVFLGFPALFGLLCMMKNAPIDSVKVFVSGADMLPDKIRAAFALVYGRKICAGYGLSEASPVVAVNHKNYASPTNNVGHVLTKIECEIRDDNDQPVEQGVIGNLWIKGDNIMLGYYKAPEATAKVLKNGWLNTGDLGMIANNGTLAVCGRTKDVIIHKGFNIYPAEIENILLRHPAVIKAAVIGKDDVATGQIPVAFVAVKSIGATIESDLRGLCSSNLAAYKVPRKIICMEDLPMNSTGKVDKKQLQV